MISESKKVNSEQINQLLSEVDGEVELLSSDERENITTARKKMLTNFVVHGLVRNSEEVATAVDLYATHNASPAKIRDLIKEYPDISISDIAAIYDARQEIGMAGITIDGLAEIADATGVDYNNDSEFLDALADLTERTAGEIMEISKRKKKEAPSDAAKDRIRGVAFRIVREELLDTYENNGTIYDILSEKEFNEGGALFSEVQIGGTGTGRNSSKD